MLPKYLHPHEKTTYKADNAYSQCFDFSMDVPIPELSKKPGFSDGVTRAQNSYPFKVLEVGESVSWPCLTSEEKRKARKAAYRTGEYKRWKVVVRTFADHVRCWRIE